MKFFPAMAYILYNVILAMGNVAMLSYQMRTISGFQELDTDWLHFPMARSIAHDHMLLF